MTRKAAVEPSEPQPQENASEGIPHTRLECLKLVHSASKSVTEILNDAEAYTEWVLRGKRLDNRNEG